MNLEAVLNLLRTRTGLEADSLGAPAVRQAVSSRMQALGLADVELYAKQLAAQEGEFITFVDQVVVPETWFFRGGDLFVFLAEHICSTVHGPTARVPFRVLSLPCSSGEEPYSLALGLAEIGYTSPCTIDGVDVSPRNLARARRGVFGELSFRQTPAVLRDRYFRPVQGGWQLDELLRETVRFSQGNLLEPERLPTSPPFDMILCRNLFIYLGLAARQQGLTNLARMLTPGGLLCLGHAEPLDPADQRFEPVGPGGYFLYRRSTTSPFVPPTPLRATVVRPPPPGRPAKRPAPNVGAMPAMQNVEVVARGERDRTLDAARHHADLGLYAGALADCARLLERFGPHADVLALMGAVQLAQHRPDDARRSLERALYLVPDHREALLHLLLLYQQQGETERAAVLRRRMERSDLSPH